MGTLKIAVDKEPICASGNVTLTVLGKTSKINSSQSYCMEQVANNNLPNGLVVNS